MKQKRLLIISFVIISLNLIHSVGYPCTTFVLRQNDKIVFGRNLDWITGTGLLMTNPRNVKKTALVDPSEKPIEWTTKYGSMTFNQIGRDLPYGGINETGLVVEHMTLEETKYPYKDDRYAIGANQWIQFQLDNYSKVEEIINSDTLLRIVDATSKYHFLISDRFGSVATIEFLDGKMISHSQNSLSIPVLANSTYDNSLKCYKNGENTDSNLSLYNFCTAADGIKKINESPNDSLINYAFHLLKSVSQGLSTKWSIVYDITNMRVYFKVFETPIIVGEQKIFMKQPGQAEMKFVDFKSFDFDCDKVAKVLNLNDNFSGVVDSQFINYTTETNKEYINQTFKFFKDWGFNLNVGSEQIDYLAKYPESFKCIDQ
jgi:hypothetical protein